VFRLLTAVYDNFERAASVVVRALVAGPARIQRGRHRRAD
jgi:hypothetical protein